MTSHFFSNLLFISLIISLRASATNDDPAKQVSGSWLITLTSNDVGVVNMPIRLKAKGTSFEAWSRRNADRPVLGFWKSTLARAFTKSFKKGSLIRVTNGTTTRRGDTTFLSGIFRSAMGSYYFEGYASGDQLRAQLKNSKKTIVGSMTGKKFSQVQSPLEDYPAIVADALSTAKDKIYNRRETETESWKTFEKKITRKSKKFKDDLDLVFAFFYYSSKLPFSHFALTRKATDPITPSTNVESSKRFLTLEEKSPSTALLNIQSFGGSASEVDSVFGVILDKKYSNLIIDLRRNSGGSVEAGMAFGRRLVDTPVTAGIFLTQNWFNSHPSLPTKDQLPELPVFTAANYDLIIEGIHKEKGLVLKVDPAAERFTGKVFILTSGITASTCEPVVYTLKTTGRATIVGKTTAGAMLNGEGFTLKSGFTVFVPTADYYSIDGYRIDGKGVTPHVTLKDEDPLQYVIGLLGK